MNALPTVDLLYVHTYIKSKYFRLLRQLLYLEVSPHHIISHVMLQ